MNPILNCILPKLGINRKFPRKLVYAPVKFSGLGIRHPYFVQNIKQIAMLLHRSQKVGITNDLVSANFEQLHMECRFNSPIETAE